MIRFSFVRDSHGTCDGETLAVEIEDINICLLMCDPPLKPPAFHPRNQIYSPPELYQILESMFRSGNRLGLFNLVYLNLVTKTV